MVIQMLLRDAGADLDLLRVRVEPRGIEAAADWPNLGSPETYLGYDRAVGFASPSGIAADAVQRYSAPVSLRRNEWALAGDWRVGPVPALLTEAGGAIVFEFHARDVNLVMGPPLGHPPVRFRIRLDGQRPGAAHGVDVDEDGNGVLGDGRLYQLVRQTGEIRERTVEITFPEPGAEAYAFTFG
jgi:hypothetical protein